jgi:hypothetical protein
MDFFYIAMLLYLSADVMVTLLNLPSLACAFSAAMLPPCAELTGTATPVTDDFFETPFEPLFFAIA